MWCEKKQTKSYILLSSLSVIFFQTTVLAESQYLTSEDFSQVTSVSQLKDVTPGDWAYQALTNLVEKYGCLAGYPNSTFGGEKALSRWEFAAALNSCLGTINQLVQNSEIILQEDIETLSRLERDFETELTAIGTRVDQLDSRVSFLEEHQFSPTTKLYSQVIFSLSDTFGDGVGKDSDQTRTSFGYRIRFNNETSFTGKDTLRVRLQMSNLKNNAPLTGTNMTRLNYDDNSNNIVQIPHVWYRTPLTSSLTLRVGPVGIGYTDLVDTITPATIADDSLGIPSKFGEYNPVYRRGGGGAGFNWMVIDNLELSLGYVAGDAQNPEDGNGLFNGTYHALAQLAWYYDQGAVGFAYSRSYYPGDPNKIELMANTGSFLANQPFGDSISTTGNFYTLQGYYRITPKIQIHAWGGYVGTIANDSGLSNISNGSGETIATEVDDDDRASIWYGLVGLTFPDVGGEGWMPGIVFGVPPKVSSSDVRSDRDTAYHIEAFYRLQVNDYIALTPGFWVIINPENNSRNNTQWVGYLRTSFNF